MALKREKLHQMPYIKLPAGEPGIIGLLVAYRQTEKPLNELANALMTGESSLSRAERELIATHVSNRNECNFCTRAHAATARHLLREKQSLVDALLQNNIASSFGEKMEALLSIAEKVRRDGRLVNEDDVQRARVAGADDRAIHDTVLISAMFSMFNRYVDGLATWTPEDTATYEEIGKRISLHGYGSRFRQ
jgi:uncharacterized peroxidase-related enzyme